MNNKELTELKKEFEQMFYTEVAPSINPNAEPPYNAPQKVDVFWNKKPSEVWNFFLPHLKSNDEIKREAVEESMLLRLSSRVHAMFRDAIDPKSVSGYNEALDDVQDMIQEYLTQQSLDGVDE